MATREQDNLPVDHPRSERVDRAREQLARVLGDTWMTHNITAAERFLLLSEAMRNMAASCIRIERRGA